MTNGLKVQLSKQLSQEYSLSKRGFQESVNEWNECSAAEPHTQGRAIARSDNRRIKDCFQWHHSPKSCFIPALKHLLSRTSDLVNVSATKDSCLHMSSWFREIKHNGQDPVKNPHKDSLLTSPYVPSCSRKCQSLFTHSTVVKQCRTKLREQFLDFY